MKLTDRQAPRGGSGMLSFGWALGDQTASFGGAGGTPSAWSGCLA